MPWRKNRFRIILRFRKRGTKLKEDYGQYSDEELLIRLRDGETAITEYIIPKVVKLGFKNRYAIMAPIGSLIAQIDVKRKAFFFDLV